MAFAETRTKLSLDRWFRLMGINPLHANGIEARASGVCASNWLQYEWQSADRVSREEVARAIAQAEHDIEQTIGYPLLPTWVEDEWRATARSPKPEMTRVTPQDVRGFDQAVQTRWGYVLSGGVRASTLVQAARPITWSDEDGDGYDETGTVTATVVAGQLACELRVYYPGESGADQYEIRPISVSVGGVTATITFRREQAVLKDELIHDVVPSSDTSFRPIDAGDDAMFLTAVDLYRVYNDPQTQVTMMWQPFALSCGCTDGCPQCAYSVQAGCLTLRSEPRLGWLSYRPATWNAETEQFDATGLSVARQPDFARLWYRAGWQDQSRDCPTIQMDPAWERAVAYYAAALLDRPICDCTNVHAWIEHWRRDLAIAGKDEALTPGRYTLSCPFGTRRGAVFAYARCQQEGVPIGRVAVG